MNEQSVRDAFKAANEMVDINRYTDGTGWQVWNAVFSALTYEPIATYQSEMSGVERLLSALDGPTNAITIKQIDPEMFKKICKLFNVEL